MATLIDTAHRTGELAALLTELDRLHQLRDSRFAAPHWMAAAPGQLRLTACTDGVLVGFLAGMPTTGHISLIGVTTTRRGIGSMLMTEFGRRAHSAGARQLAVVLDTEHRQRWERRRFFEEADFHAVDASTLHFAKPLRSS
ncbi:hypothetical protein ACTD5D_23150 [Nocardia takedensis]|uniref:hypothetical protein n=1 Tax=Nocardia takedensis TaxID=259390 RepID=UPI003F7640C1